MPRTHFFCTCILVLAFCAQGSARPNGDSTLSRIFSPETLPAGWAATDPPAFHEGGELYQLIDGGADVYLEYGFVRVGSCRYALQSGGEIGVEIYEMKDTTAAWGIFSYVAAGTGSAAPYGQEGVGGEDFVIFWKDRYLVSTTALSPEARPGLDLFARRADRAIGPRGRRPAIAELLLRPGFLNTEVFLVRGVLAFERGAELGIGDAFSVRAGVSGRIDGCRTLILEYANARQCDSLRALGIGTLKTRGTYTESTGAGGWTSYIGPRGQRLLLRQAGRFLLMVRGNDERSAKRVAAQLASAVSPKGGL